MSTPAPQKTVSVESIEAEILGLGYTKACILANRVGAQLPPNTIGRREFERRVEAIQAAVHREAASIQTMPSLHDRRAQIPYFSSFNNTIAELSGVTVLEDAEIEEILNTGQTLWIQRTLLLLDRLTDKKKELGDA